MPRFSLTRPGAVRTPAPWSPEPEPEPIPEEPCPHPVMSLSLPSMTLACNLCGAPMMSDPHTPTDERDPDETFPEEQPCPTCGGNCFDCVELSTAVAPV